MFDLQNKVAVISDGNGSIGFGMAQGLATAGGRARDRKGAEKGTDLFSPRK